MSQLTPQHGTDQGPRVLELDTRSFPVRTTRPAGVDQPHLRPVRVQLRVQEVRVPGWMQKSRAATERNEVVGAP